MPKWKRASGVDLCASLGCVVVVALPLCVCHGIAQICRVPVAVGCLGIVAAAICEGCSTPALRSHGPDQGAWGVVACNTLHGVVMVAFLQASALAAPADGAWFGVSCVAGACAMAIGVAIRCWAIGVLGSAFSDGFAPAIDQPVLRGPYRVCRHPAECGLLLCLVGFATAVQGWNAVTGALFMAVLGFSGVRVCLEERALALADLPPLNGSTSGARIQGGSTLGRAIDATWKARAGGSDHPQAA